MQLWRCLQRSSLSSLRQRLSELLKLVGFNGNLPHVLMVGIPISLCAGKNVLFSSRCLGCLFPLDFSECSSVAKRSVLLVCSIFRASIADFIEALC